MPGRLRLLVIGGGLIGGHVAREAARGGHEVAVVSRGFSTWLKQRIAAEGLEIDLVEGTLPGSVGVVGELDQALTGRDAIFCFAGDSTPALSAREPAAAAAAGLLPAISALEGARRNGCERVVLASSGGTVYGKVTQTPTPEDHPAEPISMHGVTALSIESYADFYRRQHGLAPVVLRYSNVYGPGARSRREQGVIAAWREALARGEPPVLIGDGSERRDFIYAADAAGAALAALEAEPGVYNVGAGASWALSEVLELMSEVSGRPIEVRRRPGRPVDVPVAELDHSAFTEATGWEPAVDLREGLRRTWEWVPG